MIDEVSKIGQIIHLVFEFTHIFISEKEAQQICQLFPKSADNPDGYVPKPLDLRDPKQNQEYIKGIEEKHERAAHSTLHFGEPISPGGAIYNPPEINPDGSRLLTGKDWEKINKKAKVDVMNIIVNLDNRYTPNQQMELIVERCDLTAQAQDTKTASIYQQKIEAMFREMETMLDFGKISQSHNGININQCWWQAFKSKCLKEEIPSLSLAGGLIKE